MSVSVGGLDDLVYVDNVNEDPYVFLGYQDRFQLPVPLDGPGPYAEVLKYLQRVQELVADQLGTQLAPLVRKYLDAFWTIECKKDGFLFPVLPCHVSASPVLQVLIAPRETPHTVDVNIGGRSMMFIVRFLILQRHVPWEEPPKPLPSANLHECVKTEYADLLQGLSQTEVFNILIDANFLGLPAVVSLCSALIASLIKGKSVEEIRQTFNIANDFTPEEEHALQ